MRRYLRSGFVCALLVGLGSGGVASAATFVRVAHPASRPAAPGTPLAASAADLPALRSARSRTFQTPDGSYVARLYPTAVNYQDSQGAWQPIDNTLVASTAVGAALENRANAYRLRLPTNLSSPVQVAAGDESISFALQGADAPVTAAGNEATFRGALPGVTARYAALGDAVKETLDLAGPASASSFTYALRTSPGLTPTENAAGGVDFRDASGRLAFAFAPAFMQDQAGKSSSAVSLSVAPAADGYTLTLKADQAWLASPAREYPVAIDPTVTFSGATEDCAIKAAAATTSFCSASTLEVGSDGSTARRGLLRFDVTRAIPRDVDVLSADLSLNLASKTTATTATINAHELTRAFTHAATWNASDGANAWATAGGDFKATAAASATGVGAATGAVHLYPTDLVQGWADGSSPDNGLVLKQSGETTNNVLSFTSTDGASSAQWPTLSVIYEPRIGQLAQYRFESQGLTDRSSVQVNVANGNFMAHENDLQIPGTGLKLKLGRTFNNLSEHTGVQGGGWSLDSGWDIFLEDLPDGSKALWGPSGFIKRIAKNPDGTFQKPDGINATLCKVNATTCTGLGAYTLTFNQTDERYHFRSDGLLIADEDRNNNKITFAYNAAGDMTSVTDDQGRVTSFVYDSAGFISQMTDPAGRKYQYQHDSAGNLISYTDPAGKITRYSFSQGNFNLVKIEDPLGKTTTVVYDANNRVSSLTRVENSTTGSGETTSFAYAQAATSCADTRNTVVTDARANKTTYCYDARGRVTAVFDALGHKRAGSYDSRSNVLTITGPLGGAASPTYQTTGTYDNDDNLKSVLEPGGALSTFSYGSGADRFRMSDSSDPQGNKLTFGYDTVGNLKRLGTMTKQTPAVPKTLASIDYNATSTPVCTTVTADTGPKGTLRCTQDGNAHETRYDYDAKGNLVKITPPAPLGATSYAYDAISRVTQITDGKGQKRVFSYDTRDRVTQVQFLTAAGATESTVSYSYDADGNLTQRVDATGTSSYAYDARNELTSETLPGTRTNAYAYDAVGNLASITDAGGSVNYVYDAVNRLVALTEPAGAQTTYAYDNDDQRTRTSYPNGVTETRAYNKAGRLTSVRATNTAGTVLTDFAYDYTLGTSESDLVQKMTDAQRATTTTYDYDFLGRLLKATTTGAASETYSYDYDDNSNRLYSTDENGATTSYAYNAANQITSAGTRTFAYDANGNQTSSSDGYRFAYNAKNQTTSITPPGASAISAAYADAGQDQRTSFGAAAFTNNTLGLGVEASGGASTYYVHDDTGALQSQRTSAGSYYYLFDGHPGSVAAVTDSSGAVAARYRYDPSGQLKSATGTLTNPWRFAGEYYDTQTKLYKIGARYYDPALARWTQQDPLNRPLDPREANRYIYTADDPINFIDPSGTLLGIHVNVGTVISAVKGCVNGVITGPSIGPIPVRLRIGARVFTKVIPAGRTLGCVEGAVKGVLPQ